MNEERRTKGDAGVVDLRGRLKKYALRIIRLYTSLPKQDVAQVLGRQMLRSGTSVGAHHREANRARSVAEFVSKMEGALQELDETAYWLELLVESETVRAKRLASLMAETDELLAVLVTSVKTSKQKRSY